MSDEYERIYPKSESVEEADDYNPGFILPPMILICPKCKHGNYTDNVTGYLKYTYVEIDNAKIKEIIENGR